MRAEVIVEKRAETTDGEMVAVVGKFAGHLSDEEPGADERRPALTFEEGGDARAYVPDTLPPCYVVRLDFAAHPTARDKETDKTVEDINAMRLHENFQCALRQARGQPG